MRQTTGNNETNVRVIAAKRGLLGAWLLALWCGIFVGVPQLFIPLAAGLFVIWRVYCRSVSK